MFKEEEEGDERVNAVRTGQLLKALYIVDNETSMTGHAVASACPFCMRMLSDGIADKEREDVRQLDVAEVLCESVLGKELTAETAESAENQ